VIKTDSRSYGFSVRDVQHHGLVLGQGPCGSWDAGAASLGCAFLDPDDPDKVYLFYSGVPDKRWSRGAIGLAISNDGFNFRKIRDNPIIEGSDDLFYAKEVVFPAVVRIKNRFFMVFTCRVSKKSPRSLGIAYADDVKGPWKVIRRLIKPSEPWEGNNIDNGPGVAHLTEDTILVYYSGLSQRTTFRQVLAQSLRRLHLPFPYFYFTRRIGVLKVRIRGTTKSKVEAHRYINNPLGRLNGARGNWNESLFCPGYMAFEKTHCLLPAASIYSSYPPKQSVGFASSTAAFFPENETSIQKLFDGSAEKKRIMRDSVGEIALDMPSPILRTTHGNEVSLYYGVMDRKDGVWKTALSTFTLE
jgi:hypothetical protein